MTEDRGALTAKTEQGSSTNFCHQAHSSLSMLKNSLAKPDPCFSFESLALQDHNNKAPDDEPAMVPC